MKRRPALPWRCAALLVAAVAVSGCASPPELTARNSTAPADVDLSGLWEMREDPLGPGLAPAEREPEIRIPPRGSIGARKESNRRGRAAGPSVWLFLETGTSLKITQTPFGLFISFDRAVVEEYTFGEKRVVSIGPVEAQRVSGWDGERFVVETLDKSGALLSESWRLVPGGNELLRDIVMKRPGRDPEIVRQRFDRREVE